jgi:hypothetical protein
MSPLRSIATCSALVWPSTFGLYDSQHKDPDSARMHVTREAGKFICFKNLIDVFSMQIA